MDKKTIYSKTGKGVLEIKNKAGKLSKDLVKVLTLVDGKSTIADLMAKAKFDDAEMDKAIVQLSAGGYIKEFANTSTGATSADGASGAYVDDLDFTASLTSSSAKGNPYQSAQTEWRQRESADRAKAEQEARRKREEEDKAKKEQAAKQAREEASKLAKVEAERKAKEAAALKQREETERKAKIEAEAMAQTTRDLQKILEKERLALEESEKKKQEETARRNKEEAEARARDEAEKKRKEDEERKRREEEERKRREEEERKRKEDEERKRKEDEERRRREEEERKRREEEDRRRREEEERKRREEEERKRKEDEERRRREEEERKRREEEERKRKEEEERKRREEEERKRKEEEERKRKEEEERKRKEEEERKRREEEERKRKEEEERKRREEEEERRRKEEEERKRREEEERARREEEERQRQEEERKRAEEEERQRRREEEDRRRREEDERRRKEDEEVEARRREENERRRSEEDARRREEDDRRRQEDEARNKDEDERRRREEEESARRREDDERRREEEAATRRREEEEADRRRREEEERAAASSAAKAEAPAEFDISGLKSMEDRIAAEFEKQQEAIRKREEEEENRREQDEQARLAIERAEREEEARAEAERREAEDRERRERMEQERAEREARERKRQEEKEQRIREAEERKIAAAHERQRQEELKVEAERRSREEALVNRRKEQEERDRKRAEVQAIKKSKAIRSPLDVAKPFIIGAVVIAGLLVGGVQLVPMNSYIPSVEKLASDHIKEPVTIGSMKVSILSGFTMNLENVKIGTTQDVKIDKVSLSPEFGSVFGSVKVVRRIDLESVTVAQEVLPRLPKWLDAALADKTIQVGRIVFKGVRLESGTLKLPSIDADLRLDAEGGIESARLTDGKLDVDLKPKNGEVAIEVSANKGWVSPIGPALDFTDFSARGVASRNQIRVSEFKALLYGGAVQGNVVINFGGPWSMEGELSTERVKLQELMAVYTQAAKVSGQLESRFRFSMSGADLPSMFGQPKVDGSFAVRKGDVDGVDLVRALQVGGRENVQGGATRFEEITGTLALAGDRYQYRNVKLGSGLLSATGGFDVLPSTDVTGKTYVELRSQAAQIRGNFAVNGSLKAIVLKPN